MLNITKGKINRAQKVVIYGPEGIGKSSLAAQFPDPVIIDTEGGTAHMDVRRIDKPQSWEELLSIVKEVAATPGICKTLVIDTADWAEQLITTYLCNKYKQNSISNGDFAVGEIGHALEPYLEQIAQEMVNYCKGRKTVVFLPLIATSQKFCAMLNAAGLRAAEVNGNSGDRAEVLSDFESGKYDVLCNSMLLTEGWDCPSVDCIVVLRPTKVRSLYQQMVGRGMRLSPGKDHLLLLDFLWMTARHDLCRPSSLVSKDAEIAQKLDRLLMKDDGVYDLIESEEEAERDVLAEREAALARELALMRSRKRKLVDPLQYALSIAAEDLTNYVPTFTWEMAPPSDAQIEFLERRGIFADSIKNAGLASLLIDRLKRRQQEGLATPKQIRCLEKYGFRQVGTWHFEDASHMISRLANNNWRIPYGYNAGAYRPKGA